MGRRFWLGLPALFLLTALTACGGGGGGEGGGGGGPSPGEIVNVPMNGTIMRFAWVPAGTFTMGDIQNVGFPDEKPTHTVTLANGFWMGIHEVTRGQWWDLMGTVPWTSPGVDDRRPVETVSWYDARDFIAEFNLVTGASCRLPSEAEWEYAARGGGLATLYSGTSNTGLLDDYAWFSDNSLDLTHIVGGKLPNALNLYDMSGNVWEWVEDDQHDNYVGAPANGNAWVGSPRALGRIMRGGSYFDVPETLRTAYRGSDVAEAAGDDVGFRLVCDP